MKCCTKKKRSFLKKAGSVLILLGALCVIMLICAEIFIRPVLCQLLDFRCRMIAERMISRAVTQRLSGSESYDDMVTFTYDKEGHITSVNADQMKINSLKALLTEAVGESLDEIGGETIGISVGTLTGISFLYGKGAELVFRIEPKGSVNTRLVSSFTDAGINQTMHSIRLEIDTVLSPMMPGFSREVGLTYDMLISQTVIVGEVPGSYSNIVLDDEHLSDLADIEI